MLDIDCALEMFPKTELDEAHAVLSKLLADQEKAETAIDNAEKKRSEIVSLVGKQRHVIKRLQSMMPPADSVVDGHAAEDTEDADFEPIAEIEGDVLDPITGEVVSKTGREEEDDDENPCPVGDPDCMGDEESCHDACEPPDPVLFVQPPDGGCFKRIEVGEYTTYGELVANYLSENLIDLDVEAFELVSVGGMSLPLNRAIVPPSYGGRYYIQPKPADAEPAEHEALKAQEPAA